MAILAGAMAIATFFAARQGAAARPALNSLWEWVALLAAYHLARQMLDAAASRALVTVMLAMAVGLSADAFYQYGVEIPATQVEYASDPERALRAAGVVAPPGSPERQIFENRLASSEPMATFALPNSLAGLLAPWLVLAVGLAMTPAGYGERGHAMPRMIAAAMTAIVIGGALVLTKSRGAVLGVGVGVCLLPIAFAGKERLFAVAAAVGAILVGMAAIAAAWVMGAIDREVFVEAAKSLSYRFDYWSGGLRIALASLWNGCGLGNFQDTYTRYKSATASESVADPHNFFIEVWASAGTPSAIAFVALLAMGLWRSLEVRPEIETRTGTATETATPPAVLAVWAGLPLGIPLALAAGGTATVALSPTAALIVAVIAVPSLAPFWDWVWRGRLRPAICFAAAMCLLVNLSVAGGIAFPGVAMSLWLLVACGEHAGDVAQVAPAAHRGKVAGASATMAAIGGLLAFLAWYSAYAPVSGCRRAIARAYATPARATPQLEAAAKADSLSSEPWQLLAGMAYSRWSKSHQPSDLELFERANDEQTKRRPRSSAMWREHGERWLAIFESQGTTQAAAHAVEAMKRAAKLYPNHAMTHAWLALSQAASGDREAAIKNARRAVELSSTTPHADQKLPASLAERLHAEELMAN